MEMMICSGPLGAGSWRCFSPAGAVLAGYRCGRDASARSDGHANAAKATLDASITRAARAAAGCFPATAAFGWVAIFLAKFAPGLLASTSTCDGFVPRKC